MTARRTPPPAPLLRGHPRTTAPLPAAPPARRRVGLAALAQRLTARDVWLLEMLTEHTVLTTAHITALWATSRRSANRRLLTLHRLGLLDSFRPRLPHGTAPEHYLLSRAGADLIAARHATTPAALGWNPDLITRTAYSPTLTHDLAATTFFTHLATHHPPRHGQLTAWWSERRCARVFGDLVRPDGHGTLTPPDPSAPPAVFFLEYDTGTEPHTRLDAKLHDYAEAATTLAFRPLVLFTLPSTRRETHLHQHLATHPAQQQVSIATTARDHTPPGHATHHPAQPVWLPVGLPCATRLRLIDLPTCWPPQQRPTPHLPEAPQPPGPPAPSPQVPSDAAASR